MKGREKVEGGRGRDGGVICGHRRHGEKVLKGESPRSHTSKPEGGRKRNVDPSGKHRQTLSHAQKKKKTTNEKQTNFFRYQHELRRVQVGRSLKRGGDAALSASHI